MQKALVSKDQIDVPTPWLAEEPLYAQPAPKEAPTLATALRRWRLILAMSVIGAVVAYQMCHLFTPLYAGRASLMIDPREPKRTAVSADPNSALPPSEESVRKNEIAIMRSRSLAELVVTTLHLDTDPEFNPALRPTSPLRTAADDVVRTVEGWLAMTGLYEPPPEPTTASQPPRALDQAVDAFLDRLTITSPEASRVIDVRFLSSNPERAALVANMVTDQYMQQKVSQDVAPAQAATRTLEKEIAALNVKVQEADQVSTKMRFEHGVVPAGDLKALGLRLDELNRQLAVASADRARAGARLADFNAAVASRRVESMPDVLASPLVQHLHEEAARRAAKVAEMSTVYGSGYPPLSQARAELADLNKRINQEVSKIGATYASDFGVAQSKEATLRRMIDQTQSDMAKASMSETEVRLLDRSADASRSLMNQLVTRLNDTQAEINRKGPEARVISRAPLPRFPAFPPTIPIVVGGLLVGGTAATLLALLLEQRDRSIRTTEQLRQLTSARVLGTVPAIKGGRQLRRSPPARVLADHTSMYVEHLRAVWFRINHVRMADAKTLLITSSVPGEGKSSIVASLARLLAIGGRQIVMVDADLRRPSLHRTLGLRQTPGLAEIVRGDCSLEAALQIDPASGASVLAAGKPRSSPTDILQSEETKAVLDALSSRFDAVLIDTPPVLAVHDASVLAPLVDMTIMVVRWGATREAALFAALQQLHDLDVPVSGVILSMVDRKKYLADGEASSLSRIMRDYYQA